MSREVCLHSNWVRTKIGAKLGLSRTIFHASRFIPPWYPRITKIASRERSIKRVLKFVPIQLLIASLNSRQRQPSSPRSLPRALSTRARRLRPNLSRLALPWCLVRLAKRIPRIRPERPLSPPNLIYPVRSREIFNPRTSQARLKTKAKAVILPRLSIAVRTPGSPSNSQLLGDPASVSLSRSRPASSLLLCHVRHVRPMWPSAKTCLLCTVLSFLLLQANLRKRRKTLRPFPSAHPAPSSTIRNVSRRSPVARLKTTGTGKAP